MAMLAAPQPSFSCFTNGTSSQTPGRSAARSTPQTPSSRPPILTAWPNIVEDLANCNDDQNENRNRHQDDDKDAITQGAGGEIRPRLLGSCSQPGSLRVHPR